MTLIFNDKIAIRNFIENKSWEEGWHAGQVKQWLKQLCRDFSIFDIYSKRYWYDDLIDICQFEPES